MTGRFHPLVAAEVESPWGVIRLAAGPAGVLALVVGGTREAFLAGLATRGRAGPLDLGHAPPGPAADLAWRAGGLVARHVAGEAVDLSRLPVDLGDRPEWDRLVLGAVRSIPRGETESYGGVARRIGRPGAARAVGGAVGRNPVGLLVPCHRVIAGDGSLGGYGIAAWGGREAALALKADLLAHEGVHVRGVGRPTPAV